MSGEQLERSILERKASDELRAIATAMSLEPVARSRKADLVDQILRAAGVEVEGANGSADSAEATHGPGSNGAGVNGASTSATDDNDSGPAEPKPVKARASRAKTPRADSAAPEVSSAPAPEEATSVDHAADRVDRGGFNGSALSEPHVDAVTGGPTDGGSGAVGARTSESAGTDANSSNESNASDTGGGSDSAGAGEHALTEVRPHRQQNQPGRGNQNGQVQSNQGAAAEAGNRRGRRRRGRDRERGGAQELQGGGQEAPWQGELVPVKGLLDLREEGYGFLRTSGYLPSQKDVYVSTSQVRRFALRRGDAIEGACRPASPSEKYPALLRIDTVGGMTPDEARERPRFEDLTPLFPDDRLRLEMESDPANVTARIVDLISPIGKGQRGMIVSPPKAGKTTVVKQIAHSIERNDPNVHLMVLLVDERPEEVTDMRRSVSGEVIASTFDRPSEEHTAVAELAIERAKRLVELGRDVVIVLDGITRLARAYNLAQPATGRIMSGGVDSGALYPPKKFFGAARNIEEGGSLTILATALVDTGSKMDEVIFEEFKGTGNMELRLDRKLAERRIYPAIDVNASSTRHEELLFDRSQLQQVWKLRRVLNALGNEGNAGAGLELLMDKIRTTRSNDEFLAEIAKAPTPGG